MMNGGMAASLTTDSGVVGREFCLDPAREAGLSGDEVPCAARSLGECGGEYG